MQVLETLLRNLVAGNFVANRLICWFNRAHSGILVQGYSQGNLILHASISQRTALILNYR